MSEVTRNCSAVREQEQKAPKRAWAILAVTYFASIMAPMVQFKIPALASWLFPAYRMDPATFGYLMSSMSIIGVILAFPAAFICRKMGLKATVLLSVACLGIGSVWGGSTDSLTILMISRMVEGIGIGLIGVAAPACVAIWFPPQSRGRALGIWATWVPFGIVLMFNVAPVIAGTMGFKMVFYLCGVSCLAAFILFAIVFKLPEGEAGNIRLAGSIGESIKSLKNKYIWILGAVFFIFSFCTLGIANTFYNTFLVQVLGFSPQMAGTITSINMALAFIFAPLSGIISDWLTPNNKRYVVVSMMFFVLISVFLMFVTGPYAIPCMWAFIIIQGAAGGEGGGAARPIAPLIMGRTAMGATMAMAVLQFSQNLGQTFGSPIFGIMLGRYGWMKANLMIEVPMLIVGTILAFYIRVTAKKATREVIAAEPALAD
jgi:predicted MFS family arabinose efflux permease